MKIVKRLSGRFLGVAVVAVLAVALNSLGAAASPPTVSIGRTTTGHAGTASEGEIEFSFRTYANTVRVVPPLVGAFQLGTGGAHGSGVLNPDGTVKSGGLIANIADPNRFTKPNRGTYAIWARVLNGERSVQGNAVVLKLVVEVYEATHQESCVVGTRGLLTLFDDDSRIANGENADTVWSAFPIAGGPMTAPDGGASCRGFNQGWNNADHAGSDPVRGGPPDGGTWAIVKISKPPAPETHPIAQISGTWYDNNNGVYQITQSGTSVTWTAHAQETPDANGKVRWSNTFTGTIRDGRYIVGRYADVPAKSRSNGSGTLVLEIISSKELRKIAGYAGVTSVSFYGGTSFWRETSKPPIAALSGTWYDNNNGVYQITQSGTSVTWTAHAQETPDANGKVRWSNTFTGTIRDGRYIVGRYADVPAKSRSNGSGTLVLEIISSKELRKIAGYAGVTSVSFYGGTSFSRS